MLVYCLVFGGVVYSVLWNLGLGDYWAFMKTGGVLWVELCWSF